MLLNNVPLTGQTLGVTRVPVNQNFATIDAAFLVDHVGYTLAGQGQHNKISFPFQNPDPVPQADILQLYSHLSPVTFEPELVFARQTESGAPAAAEIVEFTSAGWDNPGWTRLPSGILLKWHSGINIAGMSNLTVNLNLDDPTSPNFSVVYGVYMTSSTFLYNVVINVTLIAGTDVTFGVNDTATTPPAGSTIAYLAIGI